MSYTTKADTAFTDEQFDHIDALTQSEDEYVQPVIGGRAATTHELPVLLRVVGFTAIAAMPDYMPKSPYKRSAWAMRADGRCMPVLCALALLKFGQVDSHPFWFNKDCGVWRLSNVGLTKAGPGQKDPRYRSRYGRAGTPAYQRAYYKANKERIKKREKLRREEQRQTVDEVSMLSDKLLKE